MDGQTAVPAACPGTASAVSGVSLRQEAEIIALRLRGWSQRRIARETGVSFHLMRAVLLHHGLGRVAGVKGSGHARPSAAGKERTCLGPICRGRRTFWSPHPGVRLCRVCREKAADLGSALA